MDLDVAKATTTLAEQLKSDSIPVSRVEPKDGYLETEWFSATHRSADRPSASSATASCGYVDG